MKIVLELVPDTGVGKAIWRLGPGSAKTRLENGYVY